MTKARIVNTIRLPLALLLIGLEFTNLIPFLAEQGNVQYSRYPFQYLGYGMCIWLILLDHRIAKRVLQKPLVLWVFGTLMLLTWAMLVRTFNSPIGYTNYLFLREFGVQVNSIAFLLTCVVMFDDPYVLHLTKRVVVIATLVGVLLSVCDVLKPGTFSNIPGRGAGLYVQPNGAGMATVFGCLIGLTVIRRRWSREVFFLCCLIGVTATFSREAMVAFAVVPVAGSLSGVLSPRRLLVAGGIGIALFVVFNLAGTLSDNDVLNANWSRLTLHWSDSSTIARERLAEKTVEAFEEAPLIGQGFGTTLYWNDNQSHNSYLSLVADCGIVGILVIPALILSIRRRAWDFYAFASIFLVWGLFSHTLLSDLFGLISLAIQADEPCEHKQGAQACELGTSLRHGVIPPTDLRRTVERRLST